MDAEVGFDDLLAALHAGCRCPAFPPIRIRRE
jgi:hypothetical protein